MALFRSSSVFASLFFLALTTAQGQVPSIATGGTVNSADYSRGFAPGALISIFGSNLASSTAQAASFPLPTSLGGASVQLASSGTPIPLYFASPGQINAELPFSLPTGSVQIQVVTSAGVSNVDTITVATQAPKIFTIDFSGTGSAAATTASYQVLTSAIPAKPADTIILWMNSMGPTTGSPVAGQPAPSPPLTLLAAPTVTINGTNAPVLAAALSPGSSGLYQINAQVPIGVLTGPVTVLVTVSGVSTQANVTIPYRQLGFYYSLLGGQAVSGQTLTGVGGTGSALAFRQTDPVTWGNTGLNSWTNNTGLGSQYAAASGLALTLMNGSAVVYDNNGIESGSAASFYSNAGGGADSQKPGLSDLYAMSNYYPLVFSGYFKLAQATTVTQIIGYFDETGNVNLPFDPTNPYIKYRMNIWSNTSSVLPKETGSFVGDVFSSDATAGTFSFSKTSLNLVSSNASFLPKPIVRLTYTLSSPLNLPAGEYWLSHDASLRATPAASSTAQFVTAGQLETFVNSQSPKGDPIRFNLAGRELELRPSWSLPSAVVVRPSSPVESH